MSLRLLAAALLGLAGPAISAEDVPILSVYTYDSFAAEWGPGPAIKAGFEAECGCVVEFVAAADAIAALRRVQLEGETTGADVLVGLDTAIAGEARATGLFAPHGLTLPDLAFTDEWTDPQFVPFDLGYFAFVYDKTRLAEPPHSFEELIALEDDFKIVVQDPRSSTPGLGLVIWIAAAYGERAPDIWAGLKPHILTMTRGWSEAYNLFLQGEADMVLSYTTSPAYHVISENDDRYAAARFTEGHVAQVEVAGVLESSDNKELARRFLDYMVSPQAQRVIPTTNWMYPVIEISPDLPAPFRDPGPPSKILWVDEAAVTAQSGRWIEDALGALR
jgi:thiamine transport system substrate-binding protein